MLLKGNLHLSQARGGLPRLGAGGKKPKQRYILPKGNARSLLFMIFCWLRKHFIIDRSDTV